ncbi:MAG: DUF1304 domain-containing protein [Flavobacteriaceae bacterium]|nr:DUF1304 domain-containing protein [Flavobacteriaceae bacterium]
MEILQKTLIALVALLHFYFMILEMFYWTKPRGMKAFGLKKEFAEESKVLAANQGLYNGFLTVGLIWSLLNKNYGNELAIFFLSCVVLAGIYGAYSTKKMKIFYIQAIPALIALIFILIKLYS